MNRLRHPSALPFAIERSSLASLGLCALLCLAALILFRPTPVLPQVRPDLLAAIRVDLDETPPYLPGSRATGHLTNDSGYRLTNVRLRLDATDADGHSLPPTFGWVDGDVPAHGRAWFRILVPPRAIHLTVSVIDFHLVSIESP